jgi:hypothetical protein
MADDQVILYQVVNLDRQELFFGVTATRLEQEIERIAKDPTGPAKGWQKGDVVHWRPLTDLIDRAFADRLHREFEGKPPPNKFKVLSTFKPEDR